jgi:hypothetical protein
MAADIIPFKPPGPPPPPTFRPKRERKPAEKFSQVQDILFDRQQRVYQARAILDVLSSRLLEADLKLKGFDPVTIIDGVNRLLEPIQFMNSFPDLIDQAKNSRSL